MLLATLRPEVRAKLEHCRREYEQLFKENDEVSRRGLAFPDNVMYRKVCELLVGGKLRPLRRLTDGHFHPY